MIPLLLTLYALSLTLLPLSSYHLVDSLQLPTSMLWNDGGILFVIVLAIFYTYWLLLRKIKVNYNSVHVSLLLSLVTFLGVLPHSNIKLIHLVPLWVTIWSIPLSVYLLQKYTFRIFSLLLVAIVCLHSFWAIAQFGSQSDLGLHLLGETRIDARNEGVAKFSWFSNPTKIIRAYGPYPHPNILGGVLVVGFLFLMLTAAHWPVAKPAAVFFAVPLLFALLCTFSRSALLGAFILGILMLTRNNFVPSFFEFHKKKLVLVVLLICLITLPLWLARIMDSEGVALQERYEGIVWAWNIIQENFLWGVGLGNYEHALQQFLTMTGLSYEPWQLAPVHSVPVLFIAEWGAAPMVVVSLLLLYGVRRMRALRWLLLPLLPMLLLDHYFITQLSALWWLTLVFLMLWAHQRLRGQSIRQAWVVQ